MFSPISPVFPDLPQIRFGFHAVKSADFVVCHQDGNWVVGNCIHLFRKCRFRQGAANRFRLGDSPYGGERAQVAHRRRIENKSLFLCLHFGRIIP